MKQVLFSHVIGNTAGTDVFHHVQTAYQNTNGNNPYGSGSTTEADVKFVVPDNGTIRKFAMYLRGATPAATKSFTGTVRVNGSDTALTVTISNGSTSGNTGSTSVSVSAGDVITIRQFATNTPAANDISYTLELELATARYSVMTGGFQTTTSAAVYAPAGFYSTNSQTSLTNDLKSVMPFGGVIKAVYSTLAAAPGVGKTRTLKLYKNGSVEASAQCAYGAADTAINATGLSISFSQADTLTMSEETSGAPTASTLRYTLLIESSVDGYSFVPLESKRFGRFASAYAFSMGSHRSDATTDDVDRAAYCTGTSYRLQNLYFMSDLGVNTADSKVFTLKKTGVATALVLTLSNTTGGTVYGNTSDTVTYADTDYWVMPQTHTGTVTSTSLRGTVTMAMFIDPGGAKNLTTMFAG